MEDIGGDIEDTMVDLGYGYYGKRSADEAAPAESGPNANAEADPWYGYYGYAHRPYGYGYYGHRYGHYGYYGNRSADEAAPAESGPNANAEADPWYSYYGGYGYGAYRP